MTSVTWFIWGKATLWQSWANSHNDNYLTTFSPWTIFSETRCHYVNLLRFDKRSQDSHFFLKITWSTENVSQRKCSLPLVRHFEAHEKNYLFHRYFWCDDQKFYVFLSRHAYLLWFGLTDDLSNRRGFLSISTNSNFTCSKKVIYNQIWFCKYSHLLTQQ